MTTRTLANEGKRGRAQLITPAVTSLTGDEVERRIACHLRIVYAYRMTLANATRQAESYARCMRIAHGVLPKFDLKRAIKLGRKPGPRLHGRKGSIACPIH